jgi:biopolymer transport protein ExbD
VKGSRRIKRMTRNRKTITKMNLTSLMDVFTILVFFLLVNSGQSELLESPKQVTLPESTAESKPRETVVIFVTPEEVLVQGQPVVSLEEVMATGEPNIEAVMERLAALRETIIGPATLAVAGSQEVTILADRSIPFSVVKKIMSTCTSEGYGRISLAVIQKASQVATL